MNLLISNTDELMNAKNIELRDINSPLNSIFNGDKTRDKDDEGHEKSAERFEDVQFNLTRSVSLFDNAT